MGELREQEPGLSPQGPLERIRQAGNGILQLISNDQEHFFQEHTRDLNQQQSLYDQIDDLPERVRVLDEQEEIDKAKSMHPSSRGYL